MDYIIQFHLHPQLVCCDTTTRQKKIQKVDKQTEIGISELWNMFLM